MSRWDAVLGEVSAFDENERADFAAIVSETGIFSKMNAIANICEAPEFAAQNQEETNQLFEDADTDLTLLEEAVKVSRALHVPIRDTVRGTAQNEIDRLTRAEEERIHAANVQAIVPAVIGIGGGLITALLSALITGDL